jgi:hypothetical protein
MIERSVTITIRVDDDGVHCDDECPGMHMNSGFSAVCFYFDDDVRKNCTEEDPPTDPRFERCTRCREACP